MPVGARDGLNAVIYESYHRRMRERLQRLVTDELIASHNADPLAPPNDDLRRVLTYFAALPVDMNLVIECDPEHLWHVCRLIGPPPYRADRIAGPYNSQRDALVSVFERHLSEVLGVSSTAHHV